jgi:hypothetical protein
MQRYFFDVVNEQSSLFDYHGRKFADLDGARNLAELIAIDLAIEPDGHWRGWKVRVCDAKGQQFLSIAVGVHESAPI